MGTRGFVGFILDGQEYITYNHFDSYPGYLGANVLAWLKGKVAAGVVAEVKERVKALTVVDESAKPTPEQMTRLMEYADLRVGHQSLEDWYALLRKTQGDPEAILASGFIIDGSGFPLDSVFCEWGYLLDLDEDVFEVYKGFQTAKPQAGRWTEGEPDGKYWPVNLLASYPLDSLPDDLSKLEEEPTEL